MDSHIRQQNQNYLAGFEKPIPSADYELVRRIQKEGFEGPTWSLLSRELVNYGYAIIYTWLATGRIFKECRDKGIKVGRAPGNVFAQDDIQDLATDTVAEALIRFQRPVFGNCGQFLAGWDPVKGASLATFFVGQCLIQFAIVYVNWRRKKRQEAYVTKALGAFPTRIYSPDPAEQFELVEEVNELLRTILDKLTRMIVYQKFH